MNQIETSRYAGGIIDSATRRVIPLDADELAAVKAEIARLRRAEKPVEDTVPWAAALAVKYKPVEHGRLYGAVLGAWGLLWDCIYGWYDYFAAWNRG